MVLITATLKLGPVTLIWREPLRCARTRRRLVTQPPHGKLAPPLASGRK